MHLLRNYAGCRSLPLNRGSPRRDASDEGMVEHMPRHLAYVHPKNLTPPSRCCTHHTFSCLQVLFGHVGIMFDTNRLVFGCEGACTIAMRDTGVIRLRTLTPQR